MQHKTTTVALYLSSCFHRRYIFIKCKECYSIKNIFHKITVFTNTSDCNAILSLFIGKTILARKQQNIILSDFHVKLLPAHLSTTRLWDKLTPLKFSEGYEYYPIVFFGLTQLGLVPEFSNSAVDVLSTVPDSYKFFRRLKVEDHRCNLAKLFEYFRCK